MWWSHNVTTDSQSKGYVSHIVDPLLHGSADQNIMIYIQQDGTDQSECMKGHESIPCSTLSYVLNEINLRNDDIFNVTNISVYVYITYYQEITKFSHIQSLVNLYLIGVDNPVLKFIGGSYDFSLQGRSAFYAVNITTTGYYSFETISLISAYSLVEVGHLLT